MQISIQARDQPLSITMRDRIERRLRFDLTRFEPEVRRLEVVLIGADRARKHTAQKARVRVRLTTPPDIVVEDVEPELYAAVDRAIARAARAVRQRVLANQAMRGPDRFGG